MILLNRMFFTKHNKFKLFYFLYFLTTTSNLFLNGGRTGQIIFIATLLVVLYLNFQNKIKGIMVAILLATSIVTIAYNVSPVFKVRVVQAYNDITNTLINKDYSQSFGIRVSLWIMGSHVFRDNPLLGTGIGDEKTGMQKYTHKYNISRYQNLPNKGHIDYHNLYVQHAVQLGIPGLVLMLTLIYSLFTIKFQSNLYRNIHIAFAIAILISSTVSNFLHTLFPMVFFGFFVAILSAISKSEHQG
ncbi:MAG: O-antigen ligase family protein [Bacteroidales bacterium]|nr:O-antigen ligase family protein [Bacteroidales bacterium]